MSEKTAVDATPVEMSDAEKAVIEAEIAKLMEQIGAAKSENPALMSKDEQQRKAFDAVAGMGLTPAQIAVLNKWYLHVGWKFLGRAMSGKQFHECV